MVCQEAEILKSRLCSGEKEGEDTIEGKGDSYRSAYSQMYCINWSLCWLWIFFLKCCSAKRKPRIWMRKTCRNCVCTAPLCQRLWIRCVKRAVSSVKEPDLLSERGIYYGEDMSIFCVCTAPLFQKALDKVCQNMGWLRLVGSLKL